MELQVGDRLTDETREWEVIGRPYTTAGGKNGHVSVQRVGEPAVTELRTWGAHPRIAEVSRELAGERDHPGFTTTPNHGSLPPGR